MRNGSIGLSCGFPHVIAIAAVTLAVLPGVARATTLLGCSFGDSGQQPLFFDINPATGQASNPRPTVYDVAGLTLTPDGTLYGFAIIGSGSLYRFNPATGAGTLVGEAGLFISKPLGPVAGMDFDPATGILYVGDGDGTSNSLYRLSTTTGALSLIGPLSGTPAGISALTFVPEPAGVLALVAVPLFSRGRRRGR